MFGIAKFKESIGSFLLLLLAMQVKHGEVDVVEKFGMVFHTSTAGEENDDLLLEVAFEEREQEQEALVGITDYVALLKAFHCAVLLLVINVDV